MKVNIPVKKKRLPPKSVSIRVPGKNSPTTKPPKPNPSTPSGRHR